MRGQPNILFLHSFGSTTKKKLLRLDRKGQRGREIFNPKIKMKGEDSRIFLFGKTLSHCVFL